MFDRPLSRAAAALAVLCASAGGAVAGTVAPEDLPWCDGLPAGATAAADCALSFADTMLVFDYEGDAAAALLTLTQTDPDGAVLATSDPIPVEAVISAPALRDITSDGRPELFVPVLSGNVNTEFLVWQPDALGVYHPSGRLTGFGVEALEVGGGVVTTVARDSAATFTESAYILDIDGFIPVYSMVVDFTDQSCSFIEKDGIAAAGLDEAAILETCQDRAWE